MKLKLIYSVALLSALISLQSCTKDSEVSKGSYQSGVLVANEGSFSSATGDVTYYNSSSALIEQAIFKKVNSSFAGKVLQSITIDGDVGYLVLNGDNKIEVINSNSFLLSKTFSNPKLDKPRYLEVINGKAYVSVWGVYDANFSLVDSYIQVYDTKTLELVTTIDTDEGTENLLYNGKYLFAANYNFGGSNTVNVIDPATNTSIKKIVLEYGPGGMVVDVNNKLWVIAEGTYGGKDGKLFRVDPTTLAIDKTIALGVNPNIDLAISPDKKSLYYFEGQSIYKIGIDATTAPAAWVTNANFKNAYSLGVDPKTGEVYLGDGIDFASDGTVYVYGVDGKLKTSFKSGINPTQFIFK